MWVKIKKQSGFTIVELLIVIVVIAILAAITIVAYNGIQARAVETQIQSDLANFQKKIELAKIDAVDSLYPSIPTSSMGMGFSKSAYAVNRYNLYYCVSADRSQYAFGVASKNYDGYVVQSASTGIIKMAVGSLQVCALVGQGNAAQSGYTYASSVGVWQSWAN